MVEWKKIGDIMQIVRGASPRPIKNYITSDNNGINWIKIGDVAPGAKYITRCNEKITKEGAEKSRYLHAGDFILSNSMSFGRPYILKIDGCIHDGWIAMSDYEKSVSSGYLYEILNSKVVQDYWKMKANNGGAMTNLNSDIVRDTIIPIPSLSEQNRIVGILDTFTASIDNLKEQIAQRRKQYEYYRDQLLDLEGKEGVEMKTLGQVCEVTDYVANGSFASLRENVEYKQEPDYAILVRTVDLSNNFKGDKIYIDERAYKFLSKTALYGGEIIINNIGAGVGQTFMCPYLDEKMSLGPNSIMVRTSNNHFFYYWFNSTYGQNSIMKVVTPGAMPKFNKTGFKTILAPLPSLEEQQSIVSILDTFEASIQNLEAQLSQREKQYDYYRNKLLTFE